jgi:polysaccharide export outer membrane protein
MPTFATLAVFIPTIFFISITPGMCMTLAMTLGLKVGLRRTLWMMLGEVFGVALVAVLAVVASCGLPRSGPTKNEIFSGSVMEDGDAFVLVVDDRVNLVASVTPALGFSAGFRDASPIGSDTIRAGDVLGLTIWENVRDPLLVPAGQNATVLEEVQVDGSGFIFVPYAGRIRAAGNTPDAIRRIITEKLEEQTPDP